MTNKMGLLRLAIILLFVVTFTVVGTVAPAVYASHAPDNHFIEVHDFNAESTTTGAEQHRLCFDRTMHTGATGTTIVELYLLSDSGQRIEINAQSDERYFQEGRHHVVTPIELPDGLEPGTYQYVLAIQMDLANGEVTRTFVYNSEPFSVEKGSATSINSFSC